MNENNDVVVHRVLPAEPIETVEDYLAAGGGEGLRTARALGADAIVEDIQASGLRGRGGAGFPTFQKWTSVRAGGPGERFVVANGAEGEPATFKDRALMRRDPFRIVEGAAIAALAVGARRIFLATKRSFEREATNLRDAAQALGALGLLDGLEVTVALGPGEYLFGEETALLEVIEGRDPLPRLLPPWQHGLFATAASGGWEAETAGVSDRPTSNPTVVNNVETLAHVAHIMQKGVDWFRSEGTAESPGTVIVTGVGDVSRPGVHEVALGTPFADVVGLFGGPRPGRRLKAALSGVSNAVLPADRFDLPLSYEGFRDRGFGMGAAGFVFYDDLTDMTSVAREVSRFLAVESCGQCPPCKQRSMEITERLVTIEQGEGDDDQLGRISEALRQVVDANRCAVGTEEQTVVSSILRAFPEDVAARLEGTAGEIRPALIPLITDIADDGTVTYDERHVRKRPDWTYG